MAKSSEYWKERFIQIEQTKHEQGARCYADIEKQYRKAQKQIEGQIAVWYQRFADNNNINLTKARRMLNAKELKELRWDVQEYIRYGKENALNGQWVKQLENASARYHISRLESIKLQVQQSLEAMFGNQLDTIDKTIRSVYKDGFYRTAFEIQKGVGVGWDFGTLDERQIHKVINKPWAADGKNFSARVWENRQKLVNELNTTLTQGIILGQDPQKTIDAIARKMDTSKKNAGRLVMTEQAFFSETAQHDGFKELGVELYEIVATLDSHTSETCRSMDGRKFKMSEWEVGVTAPPFHVWCRSTTVPAFDDEFDLVGKRAARGEDGKTYYVPANMTYKEWQKSFVEGSRSGLKEVESDNMVDGIDITGKWTRDKGMKGRIVEKQEYTVNGTTYKVDGKHVVLRPTVQEKTVAAVLSEKYGKKVEFVPQVMYPQGIQTPDYLIDGDRFDLKSPTGRGKNLLYGMLAKKKNQSPNFIFDITNCPLSQEDIEKQIKGLYASKHTRFVKKIVVIKNREILKAYDRQ